jgi:hypothetical protein
MAHLPNPLVRNQARSLMKYFEHHGSLNYSSIFNYLIPLSEDFCDPEKPFKFLTCIMFYFSSFGGNIYYVEVNPKLFANQLRHMSSTVSKNQVLHFLQLAESGKFQKFDYGSENLKFYNSTKPEIYDFGKMTAEIFVYCGGGDALVAVKVR